MCSRYDIQAKQLPDQRGFACVHLPNAPHKAHMTNGLTKLVHSADAIQVDNEDLHNQVRLKVMQPDCNLRLLKTGTLAYIAITPKQLSLGASLALLQTAQ